jgi:peroxiredoxin
MNAGLLVTRLVLALVLLVAGLTKLADPEGSRRAVSDFGLPDALAGPLAGLLPLLELAAAILLLPSSTARAGAGLATVLFAAFSAAVARSIARGETPDCHCFGQLHSTPAGPKTLARNACLTAAAALVAAGGAGTSATAWLGRQPEAVLIALLGAGALVIVAAACGAVALSLLRRHGLLLLRVETLEQALADHGIAALPAAGARTPTPAPDAGLPVGSQAPELDVADLDGRSVTLNSLRTGSPAVLLVFSDPGCGPCSALMPRIAAWQRNHPQSLRIALVSRGGRDANLAHAREHGLVDLLVQGGRQASEDYRVSGAPAAVLIDSDGRIASQVHAGADAITSLVAGRLAAAYTRPDGVEGAAVAAS